MGKFKKDEINEESPELSKTDLDGVAGGAADHSHKTRSDEQKIDPMTDPLTDPPTEPSSEPAYD